MIGRRPLFPAARERQRGSAVVELAVSLPVLLLLMVGLAELGRVVIQYNALTQTNRDAVRYLAANALAGTSEVIVIRRKVETRAKRVAVYGNVNGSGPALLTGLTVNDVSIEVIDSAHVSVVMSYAYTPLFGSVLPSFGIGEGTSMTLDLRSSVVMRAL